MAAAAAAAGLFRPPPPFRCRRRGGRRPLWRRRPFGGGQRAHVKSMLRLSANSVCRAPSCYCGLALAERTGRRVILLDLSLSLGLALSLHLSPPSPRAFLIWSASVAPARSSQPSYGTTTAGAFGAGAQQDDIYSDLLKIPRRAFFLCVSALHSDLHSRAFRRRRRIECVAGPVRHLAFSAERPSPSVCVSLPPQ
jgi:hypothetical protein